MTARLPLDEPQAAVDLDGLLQDVERELREQGLDPLPPTLQDKLSELIIRCERALAAERLLRSVINATPDWIFIKDRNHRFQLVNQSYASAFGRAPEDFVGKDNLEMGWPEELVRGDPDKGIRGIWADDLEVMESGQIKLIPRDLVKVRDDLRVFDTIKIPLRDGEGHIWGLLGFARDMTELKRAEDELRTYRDQLQELVEQRTAQLRGSQQLLEKTFAALREGVIILDADTAEVLDCNPAACHIFGCQRQEMVGQSAAALHVDGAALANYRQRLDQAMGEEGFLLLPEFHMRRHTGEVFPAELSVMPLEEEGGRRVGWVTVVRDITARWRMEEYALRTERLAAMGRLAAALAHEINNPLHAMKNSLELVLDFPINEARRQEYLRAVLDEIERLMTLAHRILDFARPPKLESRPTPLAGVLRHALTLAEQQLQDSRIQVKIDLPSNLPPAFASPDHLGQVFLNLIINAIQAMPHGGVLQIAGRWVGGHVEVTFADDGPGIPEEDLPLIFEPFYTTKVDGTGLGLSVSHSMVAQYGGTISARNRPEGGALFTVALTIPPAYHFLGQGVG